MHNSKQLLGVGVAALVVGGGLGFFGTGVLNHSTTSNTRPSFTGVRGNFAGRNGANGRDFLGGTVVSTSNGSLTLNTQDGSSHVVLLTPNTTISKSVTGTTSDITKGASLIISGTTNSDGTVSANLIQIRPDTLPSQGQ